MAIALSVLFAMVIHGAIAFGVLVPEGEAYRRVATLHKVFATFVGIVPGVSFALGGLMHEREQSVHRRSNRMGWGILGLYWSGALTVVASTFIGKIDSGFNYVASYGPGCKAAVVTMSLGLLIVSLACGLNAFQSTGQTSLGQSGIHLWARLMRMNAFVQSLVIPTQVALVLLLIIGPIRSGSATLLAANSPVFLHELFWFSVQPVILSAILPVVGYVSAALGSFSSPKRSETNLIFYAAISYSILNFTSWGIHCVALGQSARMTVLFSAGALLTLVPISVPAPIWLGQLRRVPAGFRKQSWVLVTIISMLAFCGLAALIQSALCPPAQGFGEFLQISCLHVLSLMVVVVVLAGQKLISSVRVAPGRAIDSREYTDRGTSDCASGDGLLNASS